MMKLFPLVFFLVASSVSAQTVIGTAFRLNTGPCTIRSGSGSPEGVVTGIVCDNYHQTNTPYSVWLKTSGTGNTGWTVMSTPTGAPLTKTDDTNVTLTLGGSPTIALLNAASVTAGWTGTLAAPRGGTGQSSYAVGDLLYAPTTSTVGKLAAVAVGQVLASAGASTAPVYTASPSLTSIGGAANLTLNPTTNLITDPAGNNILPDLNYDINIGMLTKKYLTLHAAELWVETLVAQNTIATIGGRVLVAPTNILSVDLSDAVGATTITVKYNNFSNGHIVYMEADGKVEFMGINSSATGSAGAYLYTVTRNLDGTGRNLWYAGDALLNTGTTGNGFIDIYSVRGIKAGTEIGPTIVGNVRNSGTFNDWSPRWAVGNLDGLYGYGAVYGAAFGDAAATNVTVDATNGFRIRSGTTNKFHADTSGNLSIVGDLSVGTAGVIRSGATAFGTGTGYWLAYNGGTPQFRVGTTGGNRISWDGSNVVLKSEGVTIDSTGIAIAPSTSQAFAAATTYRWTVPTGDLGTYGFDDTGNNLRGLLITSTWTGAGGKSHHIEIMADGTLGGSSTGRSSLILQTSAGAGGVATLTGSAAIVFSDAPTVTFNGPIGGALNITNYILTASGFGTHKFSAGGTGMNAAWIENPTAGAANGAQFNILRDGTVGLNFNAYSSTYTTSGMAVQGGSTINSNGVGGLSMAVTDAAGDIRFYTGGTTLRGTMFDTGGFVWGTPTGGDKGAGTINANAVYDDNVLLTDYVFEPNYQLLDIPTMRAFYEREKHLPTIPGRAVWEQDGKFSVGQLATRLWETVEVQARYIAELHARVAALEGAGR